MTTLEKNRVISKCWDEIKEEISYYSDKEAIELLMWINQRLIKEVVSRLPEEEEEEVSFPPEYDEQGSEGNYRSNPSGWC